MRIIGFRYIRRQRIVIFIIILVLSSMLFSIMAFSLLGFYKGFSAYLGEGKDIVVVYDRKSSTPFTGLIPVYLVGNLSSIKGVIATSPEIIVPCLLKNESVFLRGVIPEKFVKLNQLVIIKGSMLELEDLNSVIVGRRIAERLNLKLGEKVLVLSVLVNRYLELQVKGIFVSGSVIDDEIIAPLYVGQWLRGTDYNYVTVIRVKIDGSIVKPSTIFEAITMKSSETGLSGGGQLPEGFVVSLSRVGFNIEDIGVNEAQKFMESYLNKYGVTRESLIVLSVMVFLLSSAAIVIASKTILIQHKGEVSVLRSIGVSKKLLKKDLLIKLLFWSLIASSIGIILGVTILTIMQENGFLQVLSHTVPMQLDPLVIILDFVLVFILILVMVLRSELE
ncbi:MAG: FtsX-like permease family protein [Thermoprotei archaeon]